MLADCLQIAGGRRYALVPTAGDGPVATTATSVAARAVADDLRRHGQVGVSSFYGDPADLGRALGEADLVLDVVRRGDVSVGRTWLERVKELTGLDPALSEHPGRLRLGLKAYRILAQRLPR